MYAKICVSILAAGLATTAVGWALPAGAVAATGGTSNATSDADGDFLPDAIEWAVLSNASNPDTDGDQIPDFVEVVARGNPRVENAPIPLDQQMRVVVTGPSPGSNDPMTWLHVLIQVVNAENAVPGGPSGIHSFQLWCELPSLPGVPLPLNALAAAGVVFRERVTAQHGIWLQLSIPMVSAQVLELLLPCTMWAESVIGSRTLLSGVKLIDVEGEIATLVPFGDGRFVVQTISPLLAAASLGGDPNRCCVLELEEVGSGPSGTIYEVVDADCEDANELECSAACPDSIGWILTIPGGTGLIGGN